MDRTHCLFEHKEGDRRIVTTLVIKEYITPNDVKTKLKSCVRSVILCLKLTYGQQTIIPRGISSI